MAITEAWSRDGVTVGSTEYSVINNSTTLATDGTDGCYQLWVDPYAMAKGDEYRIRIYEKVESSTGTQKVFFQVTLLGVQSEIFVTPTFVLMHGFDFAIKKLAGTDRAFDVSVRKVA